MKQTILVVAALLASMTLIPSTNAVPVVNDKSYSIDVVYDGVNPPVPISNEIGLVNTGCTASVSVSAVPPSVRAVVLCSVAPCNHVGALAIIESDPQTSVEVFSRCHNTPVAQSGDRPEAWCFRTGPSGSCLDEDTRPSSIPWKCEVTIHMVHGMRGVARGECWSD